EAFDPPVVRQGSGWGCAVRADDGRVECFGDGAVTPGLGRFVDVAVGDGLACAARDDGPTVCWRDAAICPVTGAPDPLPPAMDGLAVDACAVCGVDADGLADCWPRWWYRRPTP
ncbi:MAG TPA: hypothetical protein PKA64_24605, partial [Myxococcota bacterium]|nr:hypothetical protein [Myxococcota bacterium]